MKHQNQSTSPFGPKSKTKVRNGLLRKRKACRFVSKPMKEIAKQVEMGYANMQSILRNRRNRKDVSREINPSVRVINKSHKSEKVRQGNNVLPQSKQHLRGKVGQLNPNEMKEDFSPVAISPKYGHAYSSKKLVKLTNMSQGLVHRANNANNLSSQPKNLKAMPKLILNSKRRHDQGPNERMHKRDLMNSRNDITNVDNSSSKVLLEEKPNSHDDNGTEDENPIAIKKRRRYIDTNEDEDDDDQNPEGGVDRIRLMSKADNSSSKVLLEEKPNSHDDNDSEDENPTAIKKRRRYIDTDEDEDDQNPEGGVDCITLMSKADVLKDCHDGVFMPFVADCPKQSHCCSKPIDEHIWSGLLRISDKEYIALSGHVSTKSCEKVHNLSKSLSRVIEVTKQPRLKVWPKGWERSSPTSDNIGLYFFPHKMRPNKHHEVLLKELMENDLALCATIDDVDMLMFPSSLLPIRYQTFQMKHYLWGVFKPREVEALHQRDCTTGATAFPANATSTGIATDVAARIPCGAIGVATDAASIPNGDATDASTVPESSSMGAPPGRMLAFVVKQTPRLEELIREMQHEGTLVMQGEMMSTGSWPGNLATITQRRQT